MKQKFHVLITDAYHKNFQVETKILSPIGAKVHISYCKNEQDLLKFNPNMDALLVSYIYISEKIIEHFSNCRAIVKYGVGVDNIDLKAATKHKILVANVPDYCSEEVSTHTMALLLALSRKIITFDRSVKKGKWNPLIADPIYHLKGKTLGIVGFGKNGQSLAKKIRPFKVNIIASDPLVSSAIMAKYGVKKVNQETIFQQSHYISLHCPLNESTYHLINHKTIDMMRDGVFLINTSRGAIIDQAALYSALKKGKIAGAALDVLENEPPKANEILKMDKVIYTPHVAWYSEESEVLLRKKAALEVKRVLQGKKPINLINKEVIEEENIS